MAWEGPESPGTLPMPLQYMACAEANQRIYRHAASNAPTAGDLIGTPVGQIVGMIKAVVPAKQVVYDMVQEYIDTIEKRAAELQAAAG